MARNNDLGVAKTAKKDEFYTQLTDIEKEMRYYRKHFKGKIVLCNCDDPFESNFFKYFVLNFNRLGLKKLIATCYYTSPISGEQLQYQFDPDGQMTLSFGTNITKENTNKHPYKAVVTQVYDKSGDGSIDMIDIAKLFESGENRLTELKGDGDFRSDECLSLLDEADIVVTNPPFSLFRDYVSVLMEHQKNFIIIGNVNAITYKEFFPLIKENKVWFGASIHSGDRKFYVPDDYPLNASGCGIDEEGHRYIRVKGVRWYTNLDLKQRHEELILVKRYTPERYPKYENYNAINVNETADIPCDYDGIMGVPITFMDKYCPEQFEILGLSIGTLFDGNALGEDFMKLYRAQGGTGHYSKNMIGLGLIDIDGKAKVPYGRILIRNKHPEAPYGGKKQ